MTDEITLNCQHCGVNMGDWPETIYQMPQFCPFCGERVMPIGGGEVDG